MLDNFPPKVRAMLDACAQSGCRRPVAGVNACRGRCGRTRVLPQTAEQTWEQQITPFRVKARCPVGSLQDLDGDPPHYSRPVSSGL